MLKVSSCALGLKKVYSAPFKENRNDSKVSEEQNYAINEILNQYYPIIDINNKSNSLSEQEKEDVANISAKMEDLDTFRNICDEKYTDSPGVIEIREKMLNPKIAEQVYAQPKVLMNFCQISIEKINEEIEKVEKNLDSNSQEKIGQLKKALIPFQITKGVLSSTENQVSSTNIGFTSNSQIRRSISEIEWHIAGGALVGGIVKAITQVIPFITTIAVGQVSQNLVNKISTIYGYKNVGGIGDAINVMSYALDVGGFAETMLDEIGGEAASEILEFIPGVNIGVAVARSMAAVTVVGVATTGACESFQENRVTEKQLKAFGSSDFKWLCRALYGPIALVNGDLYKGVEEAIPLFQKAVRREHS